MDTLVWKVNPVNPEPEIIDKAVKLLKESKLVAFPTETVYGLGAVAFDYEAVQKIFAVKGRPSQKPLLVHVNSQKQVESLVKEIPSAARLLMNRFWPGPLSIILPARESIPAIIRGGGNSIGLRMPSHQVARALIEKAGPLAAPSANLSGHPSPITAKQVKGDLGGKIDAILDAGPTRIGIASTIIDLTGKKYRILREGGLPVKVIVEALEKEIEI